MCCWKTWWEGTTLPCSSSQWESFEFLTTKYDISSRFFVRCSSNCRNFSLFLVCWAFLSWIGVEVCQMLFLHLLIWSCDFSSFNCWLDEVIDFQMLNQPWIPGINRTWSWYIVIFIYCCIWRSIIIITIIMCKKHCTNRSREQCKDRRASSSWRLSPVSGSED